MTNNEPIRTTEEKGDAANAPTAQPEDAAMTTSQESGSATDPISEGLASQQASAAEEPAVEQAPAEEPAVEQAPAEEPVAVQAPVEEPVAEQAPADQPADAGPSGDQPAADNKTPQEEGLHPAMIEAGHTDGVIRTQEGALPASHATDVEAPPAPAKKRSSTSASSATKSRRKRSHKPGKLVTRPIVSRLPELEEKENLGICWYVVRVQAGRENRVRKNLERRAKEEGMTELVKRVLVPTEMVSEIKSGKRRNVERKLYPGYVMVEMELTEQTLTLVKRTPGVGDFVGPGNMPAPMSDREVEKVLGEVERRTTEQPTLKINLKKGESVKIKEGAFENFDGAIDDVNENKGTVRVLVTIFGRPTPIELEYWQVEPI